MAPRTVPLTWRNVSVPDSSGALRALSSANEDLESSISGFGDLIKQGTKEYVDEETQQFITVLNAAPDDETRKQMVAVASQAFLDTEQINKSVTDAEALDIRRAGENRAVAGEQRDIAGEQRDIATHKDDLLTAALDRRVDSDANDIANAEAARQKNTWNAEAVYRQQVLTAKLEGQAKAKQASILSESFESDLKGVYDSEGTPDFANQYNILRMTYQNDPKLSDKHKGALKTLRDKAVDGMIHSAPTTAFHGKVENNRRAREVHEAAYRTAAAGGTLLQAEADKKAADKVLKETLVPMGAEDLTVLAENVFKTGKLTIGDLTRAEASSIMTRMLKSSGLDANVKNIKRAVDIALKTATQTEALVIGSAAQSAAEGSIQQAKQEKVTTAVTTAQKYNRSVIAPVANSIMEHFGEDNAEVTKDERLQKSTVAADITTMIAKLQTIDKWKGMNKGELALQIGAFLKDNALINTTGTTTELAIRDKSQWTGIIGLGTENEIADIGANNLDRMMSQWQRTNNLGSIRDRNDRNAATTAEAAERIASLKKQINTAEKVRDGADQENRRFAAARVIRILQKKLTDLQK